MHYGKMCFLNDRKMISTFIILFLVIFFFYLPPLCNYLNKEYVKGFSSLCYVGLCEIYIDPQNYQTCDLAELLEESLRANYFVF